MNSPIESNDATYGMVGQSRGSFGYGICISLGLLILLVIITYASYICTRLRSASHGHHPSTHRAAIDTTSTTDNDSITTQRGLDEATILTYPKFLYSEAKLHKGGATTSGCSICLADYKDTNMLRLLPNCGHLFHRTCIDPWLRLHPTCPICRNSSVPTPLGTPLAVVVPFATR